MFSSDVPPMQASGQNHTQATWELFFDTVQADYLFRFVGRVMPLPEQEDPAHPGVRAMQRGRRFAWMHARHVAGLSMFESIQLSQRLAEAFARWTRSDDATVEALRRSLRETEQEARKVEPIRMRADFVEALETQCRRDGSRSIWEVALDAYREVDRKYPPENRA